MPLRATIEGKQVIAPLLSAEAWEALRQRVAAERLRVVLPCCEVEGYLRKSRFGTQHFAHKRGGQCGERGETLQHLTAKADIVLAAGAAGYTALTEVAGDGWRADVLAERGAGRIAFEVQWSFLRLEEAERRQERYARDDVRGCWFFRRPPDALFRRDAPDQLAARRDLPLFHLFVNADLTFSVALNGRLHRLADFVTALLTGRVRFCEMVRAARRQQVRAAVATVPCPRCASRVHALTIPTPLITPCGLTLSAPPELALHPAVTRALAAYRQTDAGGRLRMGEIRTREGVLSFGCPACDAPITPEAVALALYGGRVQAGDDSFPVEIELAQPLQLPLHHWCFPAPGVGHCC
jgi:hypothetical protein